MIEKHAKIAKYGGEMGKLFTDEALATIINFIVCVTTNAVNVNRTGELIYLFKDFAPLSSRELFIDCRRWTLTARSFSPKSY